MAKKKTTARRVPRSATPRTFGDGQAPTPASPDGTQAPAATRTNGAATVSPRATSLEARRRLAAARSESRPQRPLREEYGYVPGDLRRLGIVAAALFVLMLGLGLIIY